MPRHPRSDEPSSVWATIRLTPTERRELDAVAAENGSTVADVMRDAVNEYVADYRERRVFRARIVSHNQILA